MANLIEAYAHLAGQTIKTGWYATLYQMTHRQVSQTGVDQAVKVSKPTPPLSSLLADMMRLHFQDTTNIRNGIYPLPTEHNQSIAEYIETVRDMFADLPASNQRRLSKEAHQAAQLPQAHGLPDYYTQNFHFQSDGYLTPSSARLYDIQVETLFMGAAATMRRQAIRPIVDHVKGHRQQDMRLLEVACGSGRFLGQLSQALPALPMTGVDLSQAYLDEATRYLSHRRGINFTQGNAENLPFEANQFDVVTCVYLYHELPHEVRERVTQSISRVLKPGGLLVFVDSLQSGDVINYDSLLEAFPQRFHEPYYMDYLNDKLDGQDGLFAESNLQPIQSYTAFLSKIITCCKPVSSN